MLNQEILLVEHATIEHCWICSGHNSFVQYISASLVLCWALQLCSRFYWAV